MTRTETKWLVSVIMSLVMVVSTLSMPLTAMAADETETGTITYVNSDGEEEKAYATDDNIIYRKVNSDGQDVVKVIGYTGISNTLKIPETIEGLPVVSFAIDPRWPVYDEQYYRVDSIELPKTIECAHSNFLDYFVNLKSVKVADGNQYYKTTGDGVLYKLNNSGMSIANYPSGKKDTSYVMPEEVNRMYTFKEDCPIESLTISKNVHYVDQEDLYDLDHLKAINVQEGNPAYFSDNGVLYEYRTDDYFDDDTEEWVEYTRGRLSIYPSAKEDESYSIPDKGPGNVPITGIGYDAFDGNIYIKHLELPTDIEYVSGSALYGADELANISFRGKNAPSTDSFINLEGLRRLANWQDEIKVNYPEDGVGYDDLLAWLNGLDYNGWEDHPYLAYDSVPLGSNREPLAGVPYYGEAYNVYSDTADGTFTTDMPDHEGTWYAKLRVDGVEKKYTGIESKPFEFEVFEVTELPAENEWIKLPYDVYANVNEGYDIIVTPLFGQVDRFLFRPVDSDDTEENWTDVPPTKAGTYYYKLIVDGTDEYTGIVYTSSDEEYWLSIDKKVCSIDIEVEDTVVGDKVDLTYDYSYEEDAESGIALDDIKFKYYKYIYDEEEGETVPDMKHPIDELPTELGTYAIQAYIDENEEWQVEGYEIFSILTKVDYAKEKIEDLESPKYLSENDEDLVDKAKKAYDALSQEEKDQISDRYADKLDEAIKRMESLLADTELEDLADEYNDVLDTYYELEDQAVKSKELAEEAAKTPGAAAVAAAQKAKADAEALAKCGKELEALADEVVKAGEKANEKAQDDPVKTRYDKQQAGRNVAYLEDEKKSAAELKNGAEQMVQDAEKQESEAIQHAAAAGKKLKVSGFKVKALKKGKAQVTWKVNSKGTGYQIQYSLKKNMKKAKKLTVKKASVKKATAKKLKKRKTYYFRMRTITSVKNSATGKTTTTYGKWTKVKKIRAK